MSYLFLLIAFVLLALILLPFFAGRGGKLAEASFSNSQSDLQELQAALLRRFLHEEAAFANEEIGKRVWDRRREFLINRYIDTTRRLDFLTTTAKEQ